MTAHAVLLFAVLVTIATDRAAKDAKKEKDLDKLQGEWTIVSMETKGKKSPYEDIKEYKLAVKGNQWTFKPGNGTESRATVKLDPSKDPKRLDLLFEFPRRKILSRGIYKLEDDTLTLCRTMGAIPRPEQFKTTERVGFLIVWKKKASSPAKSENE